MKLELKLAGAVCVMAVALVCTGCSGLSASPSVSPASFFLPGLMQVQPPVEPVTPSPSAPESVPDPTPPKVVALAR